MKHSDITISQFKSERIAAPTQRTLPWSNFVKKMGEFPVRDQKLGSLGFSGALYPEGAKRGKDYVSELTLIVLDFDAGDPEEVCNEIHTMGLEAVVASSFSHTPEKPKFRVVFLPSRSISPDEWGEVFRACTVLFPNCIDATGKDASRMYFWPCTGNAGAATFSRHLQGCVVDVDESIAVEGPEQPLKTGRSNASKAKSGVAAGAAGNQDRLTSRDIAEHMFNTVYKRQIWFYRQAFRIYEEGHWQRVTKEAEPELVQRIMVEFPGATINQAKDAMKTLEVLAAHVPVESDQTRLLLCLNNGVLDPLTGQLTPHDPADRLTFKLFVDWDAEAARPLFDKFLADIWGKETDYGERVQFLQQWLGYLLLRDCRFERFLWMEGRGANGKSVLLKIMAALVGEMNVSYAMLERLNKSATRAELEGKLLNISSEMSANATVADGYLKQITSGESIEADRKYRDSMSFKPYAKLVASTNTLPRLLDRSDGFARRAVILSFNRCFDGPDRDVKLADKIIAAELAGILSFAVEGLQLLLQQGKFTIPASSDQAVKTYRTESDAVAMFVHERLKVDQKGALAADIYQAFKLACASYGFAPCNIGEFGRRLSGLGVGKRESNGKVYRLVRLLPDFARELSSINELMA